jgi:nucleoside-diphosphate-sugar epimerase
MLHMIAGLSEAEKAIFDNKEFVAFKQADLAGPAHVEKVFEHDGGNWQYVINCAAVTKYSQGKEVYEANIVQVAKLTSAAAIKHKCRRYIHVSTAQVYNPPSKAAAKETSELKPWTDMARAHNEAEAVLKACAGLNYVIVRPAIVYGPGDIYGLTPRLMTGSIYKEIGKSMETLYTKHLQLNTVHVRDVVKAIWFLTGKGDSGSVWNLVDKAETDQGKINSLLEEIYGIKTGFLNSVAMLAAKALKTKHLVEYVNDMHLKPFSDAMKKYGISDTPLTPYLDEELIKDNDLWVDGKAIEGLGFKYDHPEPTGALLKEVLQDYVAKKYFPKELVG